MTMFAKFQDQHKEEGYRRSSKHARGLEGAYHGSRGLLDLDGHAGGIGVLVLHGCDKFP